MSKDSSRACTKLLAAAAALASVTARAGQAQELAPALEEVIVTALKRTTNLQQTPLAISVVDGASLHDRGLDSVSDLLRSTPGLTVVDQGAGQRRLVIRGIQSAGEAQTGLYYDESPVGAGAPSTTNDAGQRMPELRLFDVERVEVLRGPQGTLYGAGSMGGTVRVLFNKPAAEWSTKVSAGVETTERGDAGYYMNGMVNVPLIDERLAARAVGYYRNRGGYIDNVTLGRDDVNEELSRGGRLLMRYTPSDALTIDVSAHLQREDSSLSAWELPAGSYRTAVATQLPVHDDFELYNLTARWQLGFADLTGVSSLFKRDLRVTIDATRLMQLFGPLGAPFSPAVLDQPQDIEDRSHELRMSSNDPNAVWQWTVGAYFEERDAYTLSRQVRTDPATGLPREPLQVATSRNIADELQQRAAFGEVSYALTPSLTATAGVRYFEYDKTIVGETTVGFPLLGAVVTPPTRIDSDEDGWVSKLNLSYRMGERALLYAQASEGFRPGGVNQVLGLPQALTPYDADALWNYEAGLKTRWLEDRVALNLAVFRIDWDDMQVVGRTPDGAFNFISNAGAAQIDGVELDLTYLPVRGLELTLAGSYTDARLSEDQRDPNVNAAGRDGDRIPNVPKTAASFAAAYEWALGSALNAMVRLDANYVDESFSEFRPTNPFYERIDDYTLTNLRVRVGHATAPWSLDLYVNNLLDDVAITRVLSTSFGRDIALSAAPRTIGLEFTMGY